MDIFFRRGKSKDLEKCTEIVTNSELFEKHYITIQNLRKYLFNWFSRGYDFFIVENDDGEMVGFCVFMETGSFGDFPYIKLMVVKKEFRRMGIGTKLLEYCDKKASGIGLNKIFLFVDDFNPLARKLYERNGYQEVGKVENMWTEGVNDFMMMKKIKTEVL